MSETEISNVKAKIQQPEIETNLQIQNLEFVCESNGFRYYKDAQSGRQFCLDSAGFWFVLNEEKGAFEPMASVVSEKQTEKPRPKHAEKAHNALRNVARFGIRFDHQGKPVFPKNEKGLYILPKDEKGSPFFPIDERSLPIFPWDHEKGLPTFPVDDTDEPIFPRNDQNKPIVPLDANDQPIFPVDKSGAFIFPVDETNCPIPALTDDGTRVVPKDEFGNLVIPRDRDGKVLIHIASDGVTPISMGEWKQWKKYYKEQARNFYHQQQQLVAAEAAIPAGNYSAMNSMFHPLNLEQQSAFFAADMEMLQRVRRVRPEDVDLPGQMVGQHSASDQNAKQTTNGAASGEDREEKRKKLLKAQLKSAKMVVPPAAQNSKKANEENKKNDIQPPKEAVKKSNEKPRGGDLDEKKRSRELSGESGKRGKEDIKVGTESRKRSREMSRENSRGRDRRTRRPTRSRSAKRRRRDSSSSSYSSSSRSRSSRKKGSPKAFDVQFLPLNFLLLFLCSRSFTNDRNEEEERIRDRIIARSLSTTAAPSNPQLTDGDALDETMEYGPKPPASLEHSSHNSDMEMSEEDDKQPVLDLSKDQHINTKHEIPPAELPDKSEKGANGATTASPTKTAESFASDPAKVVVERRGPFTAEEALGSGNLELIKQCKDQERERYDQLKLQIAELLLKKSTHKWNWTQLREAEKRILGRRTDQLLSGSSEDESK
uniref:Uncharacterized protein n=1 Tax=Globodera rostochiensis TaxID=31243 RepID=A0A914HD35_GLORO